MGNCIRRRFDNSTPPESVQEPPPPSVPDVKDQEIAYLKFTVRSQEMEMAHKDQELLWCKEDANKWKKLYEDHFYIL